MSDKENISISIALCTYNGQQFLPAQFKSIIGQTIVPSEIVVCDDASTDSTVSLVNSFLKNTYFQGNIIENENSLGVIANYSQALSLCQGEYVALCDQDDIWQPDRISRCLQHMIEAEKFFGTNTPLLVHSDLQVIDSEGHVLAPSFVKFRKLQPRQNDPLKILLVQNFVTGCTVLVNRSLLKAALPIPEYAVMHDWWLALVAAAAGKIIYEPKPLVIYRKHGKNVIGAKGYFTSDNVKRLGSTANLEAEIAGTIDQALVLRERLNELPIDTSQLSYLDEYLEAVLQGGTGAAVRVYRKGIKKCGLFRSLVFYLLLMKGSYKRGFKGRRSGKQQ